MSKQSSYSREPVDKKAFTEAADRLYDRWAGHYDIAIRFLPFWRQWLDQSLPYLVGPRVLEISFGTGYLMSRYAGLYECHGIDYNRTMVATAQRNLKRAGVAAELVEGNVEDLPYVNGAFDSVLITMAFTAYPDADRAMTEIHRVLRPGGRLLLIDVNFPSDGNRLGTWLTQRWQAGGDIVRDLPALLRHYSFSVEDREIGGFGSIHLTLAEKSFSS